MLAHASPESPEGPLPGAKGQPGPVGAPGGPKGATKGPKRGSRALNGPQTGPSGFGDFWIIQTFQMGPDEGPKAPGPRRGPGGRLSGLQALQTTEESFLVFYWITPVL